MLPSQYLALEESEKAFIIACIDIKAEHDRKEEQKLERKASKGKKGK